MITFSGADSAAHWGQIVDFPVQETMETNSLRIGGWWWAPKSTVLSFRSFLEHFLIPVEIEKSPQIELELERSFDGPLFGQSVYEQTSGVPRHTESVRDDKVQEQDWSHPPAHAATSLHSLTRCQAAKVSG